MTAGPKTLCVAGIIALSTAHLSLMRGRVSFDAPPEWPRAWALDADSTGVMMLAPPNTDALNGPVQIVIDLAIVHRRWDLTADGNAKLRPSPTETTPKMTIEAEFRDNDSSRTVLSEDWSHGVPFTRWDKFAVRDSLFVHIRTTWPVGFDPGPAWKADYRARLNALLLSMRIGTEPVFRLAHLHQQGE
jgi:hypothetical protein